jgi:hypothetical protein
MKKYTYEIRKTRRNWNTGPRRVGGGYAGKILVFAEHPKVERSVACLAWKFKTYRKRRSNRETQDGLTALKK